MYSGNTKDRVHNVIFYCKNYVSINPKSRILCALLGMRFQKMTESIMWNNDKVDSKRICL